MTTEDTDTVETEIDDALERVREERRHVSGEREAYLRFRRAVEEVSPRRPRRTSTLSHDTVFESRRTGACEEVLDEFAETVRPYSVEDLDEPEGETVLETVSEELGTEIALALSPETGAGLPKEAVLSAVDERVVELELFVDALEEEEASLRDAHAVVEAVTESILENNAGEVYSLSFDQLCERHERLESHKDRCERTLAERQEVLHGTTAKGGAKGLEHQELVSYLYEDLPTDHPVLATTTRLYGLCEELQQRVSEEIARTV